MILATLVSSCNGDSDTTDGEPAGPVKATIVDHEDKLSAEAEDRLFTLHVTASDQPYAMADLTLFVELVNSSGMLGAQMAFIDNDNDDLLGPGDAILASEGGSQDRWNAGNAGQSIEVELRYRWTTAEKRDLFGGSWNAE